MMSGRPDPKAGSPRQAGGPSGPSDPGFPDRVPCPTLLERAMIWIGCACAILIFLLSLADIVLRSASVEFFLAGEANGNRKGGKPAGGRGQAGTGGKSGGRGGKAGGGSQECVEVSKNSKH